MNIQTIKQRATDRFNEYVKNYDISDPKIALKAFHTMKVAQFCEEIAASLGLSENDILVAWLCGLLHDIGRFEQIRRFDTFVDAISFNHGHLSAEILWGTDAIEEKERCPVGNPSSPIIRDFIPSDEYDAIIRAAIWEHNAYRIADGYDERTLMFCNILRDADKVDIFRVIAESDLSDTLNIPDSEFHNTLISTRVMEAFFEHHCVLRSLKETPIDYIVGYISFFWELVYEKSRTLALEQGYLKKLVDFRVELPEAKKQFELIRKELSLT